MSAPRYSLTLVGCGKMGGALLKCWLENDLLSAATIIEPNEVDTALMSHKGVTHHQTLPNSPITSDILVLAVKPQTLPAAAAQIKTHLAQNTLILSIAAGQSLSTLGALFAANQPVIRSMPNTPAAIGKGITVAIPNNAVSAGQKDIAERLLAATGKTAWISDETLMDAITALSGSGPAYLFYFIEALAKAGESVGLAPDLAMHLARQTVIGSAALAENESNIPAATLRQNVTSPGGTTAAALHILMDGRFQSLLEEALAAARNRGTELNKN